MTTDATRGTFNDILAIAAPPLRPACRSLRHEIAALHPEFVEIVWPRQRIASYGVGPRKMTEHYSYIAIQDAHINLGFYHGTSLPDPEHVLEGTGKKLRHIKICEPGSDPRAAIIALLQAAIAERKCHAKPD